MIFLKGLLLGLTIAAPVGPIGMLCIRRTVSQGRLVGFFSGLGAATADAFYASIAGFGLAFLSSWLSEQENWLRGLGGVFLIYLGIRAFWEKPARQEVSAKGKGLPGAYLSTLLLTLTNPMTILSFSAAFLGFGVSGGSTTTSGATSLVLGVFCGSAAWWLILSSLAGLFHGKLGVTPLTWVNRVASVALVGFGALALLTISKAQNRVEARVVDTFTEEAQADTSKYSHAKKGQPLIFPRDFGAHPDYQTEWWYFTGNLATQDGRRFGFQLTFFRRALAPPADLGSRQSQWATSQAYLAHFALTDVTGGEHYTLERLGRGAVGLAGAQPEPFQVWLEDWSVVETAAGNYHLKASIPAQAQAHPVIDISLDLQDLKGPVLQGDQGYSQKGAQEGNASYYYSLTRLRSQGNINVDGKIYTVSGLSWMDHEYSTSALAADQVGWDWFSIQLDNGSELMVFQIRRGDGAIDPFSTGLWISAEGQTILLKQDDFVIQVENTWLSQETQAAYPARWHLSIAKLGLEIDIQPLLADQELNLSYVYWEGAVSIKGLVRRENVSGYGYVELTGYARSMGGKF